MAIDDHIPSITPIASPGESVRAAEQKPADARSIRALGSFGELISGLEGARAAAAAARAMRRLAASLAERCSERWKRRILQPEQIRRQSLEDGENPN